jgi:hypothetical protein
MCNKDVGKLKEEMQAKELVKQAEQKRRGNCHEHAFSISHTYRSDLTACCREA